MKIENFSINDLYWKYDLSIQGSLNKGVNIFVGDNGSFKSTLIKVLYSVLLGNDTQQDLDTVKIKLSNNSNISYDKFPEDIFNHVYQYNGSFCTKDKLTIYTDFISVYDYIDGKLHDLLVKYGYYLSDLAIQLIDCLDGEENISKDEIGKIYDGNNLMVKFINNAFRDTGKKFVIVDGKVKFKINDGSEIDSKDLSYSEKKLLVIFLTILLEREKCYIVFIDDIFENLPLMWVRNIKYWITSLNPKAQFMLTANNNYADSILSNYSGSCFYMSDIKKSHKIK